MLFDRETTNVDTKHPLIAQAIGEIGMGQASGMQLLTSSFGYAERAHATRRPQPTKSLGLENDPRFARDPKLKEMFLRQDANRTATLDKGFANLHRTNLAEFFTISGVSRETAFQIVDEFFLKSK